MHDGMSLRDWFAGQALAGMLSAMGSKDYAGVIVGTAKEHGKSTPQTLANLSYSHADAMLKERGSAED